MKYFDDYNYYINNKQINEGISLNDKEDISKTFTNEKDFSTGKKDKMGSGQNDEDNITYELNDENKDNIKDTNKEFSEINDNLSIIHTLNITNIDIKSNEIDYFIDFYYKRIKCIGILTIDKNNFDNISFISNLMTLMQNDEEYDDSNVTEFKIKGYIKHLLFEMIFPKEAEIYKIKSDELFFTDSLLKHYSKEGDSFFILEVDLLNKTIKICPRYIKNKVITLSGDDFFKFYSKFTLSESINIELK